MDTKPERLSVKGSEITFRSLSLGGVRGKVRATLNESQVSFESRSGHALDIRLDAIKRVHHHHTTLVPGWLGVIGAIMVWVAWRGVTGRLQAVLGAAGIVLSAAHFITRRPTLTIDTNADDCHTVFGSDIAMLRLCSLIQKINNGMSLEDAKANVDAMVSDSEYPRSREFDLAELIPEPVELFPSPVLSHFLDAMDQTPGERDSSGIEAVSPAIVIEDLDLPIWDDEVEDIQPEVSPSLISRAQSNLFTQRHNVAQNGWQEPPRQQPYQGVHRSDANAAPSYGMIQQQSTAPYSHQTVNPQPTPIPTEFLPSFVGANGAHVPGVNPEMFSSPDSPLSQPLEEIETTSLVASARRETPLDATLVGDEVLTPKDRYPKMSKLSTKPGRRRITSRKNSAGKLRGSSVIAELVKPSIGRANRIAKRLFRRKPRTAESLRIQAEHSRQSQLVSSIQDLAKSNGGEVSDEEVREMMSHISPKPIIPASFGDLVSTETKNKPGDIASLPRLDE
tara:strand:+ start:854 stop:2371 length:1518 start_codon:yes stop_codon:yes gene_type:complete